MPNESEKELDVATPIETEEESVTDVEDEESQQEEFTDTTIDSNQNSQEEVKTDDNESKKETDNSSKNKMIQSKDERAKYAQARRKKESEDKRIKEAYNQGKLEAFKGKINPYTNQVINDQKDVEVYENMYKLSTEGKDPVADYASYIAQKEREQEIADNKQREIEEKAAKDIDEFIEKYPNVNLNELFEDSTFNDYMEGKNKSISEIYEGYTKLKNSFRTESINQAKATIANSKATPGSLNNISDDNVDYEKMSREDFLKEVERIKNGV